MCDFIHQEGACVARAARAEHAVALFCQARDVAFDLERQQRIDQLDLFAPPPVDQAVIDFWWSVYRACAVEYRRLERLFWTRCPHSYADREALA